MLCGGCDVLLFCLSGSMFFFFYHLSISCISLSIILSICLATYLSIYTSVRVCVCVSMRVSSV